MNIDPIFPSPPNGLPPVYKFKPLSKLKHQDPLEDVKCPIESRRANYDKDEFSPNIGILFFCVFIFCLIFLFE